MLYQGGLIPRQMILDKISVILDLIKGLGIVWSSIFIVSGRMSQLYPLHPLQAHLLHTQDRWQVVSNLLTLVIQLGIPQMDTQYNPTLKCQPIQLLTRRLRSFLPSQCSSLSTNRQSVPLKHINLGQLVSINSPMEDVVSKSLEAGNLVT